MPPSLETAVLVDYPAYSATSDGFIFRTCNNRRLSHAINFQGYVKVSLKVNGQTIPKLVHTLVLLAFKGGPPSDGLKYTCDHKDRKRSNNSVHNLKWSTPTEQAQNSARVLFKGNSCPSKFRTVIVTDIHGEATIYPRVADAMCKIAPEVHPSNSRVYQALKDGTSAFGCTWQYAPPPNGLFKEIPCDFIKGAKGYFASDTGYIKSPSGKCFGGSLGTSREYYVININKNEHRVHRLIAATFLPGYTKNTVVNHKNGVKTDNILLNLEWVTYKENSEHAVRTGLIQTPKGRKVDQLSKEGMYIQTFDSINSAARVVKNEGGRANIIACCKGLQKSAYGYKWKYT